jgi:hypothetical protein
MQDLEDEKGKLTKQTINYLARSLGGKDRKSVTKEPH